MEKREIEIFTSKIWFLSLLRCEFKIDKNESFCPRIGATISYIFFSVENVSGINFVEFVSNIIYLVVNRIAFKIFFFRWYVKYFVFSFHYFINTPLYFWLWHFFMRFRNSKIVGSRSTPYKWKLFKLNIVFDRIKLNKMLRIEHDNGLLSS